MRVAVVDGDGYFAVESFEGDERAGLAYGHELAHPDGDRTVLLYSLDVDERFRRRGHGRAVVEAFVAEAARRGASEVWVLTDDGNPAGLATYRSAGGERDQVDQVMFTWPLATTADSSH